MKCGNKECDDYDATYINNCGAYRGPHLEQACKHHKPLIEKSDGGATVPCSAVLSDADDYAYKDIAEFEEIVEHKVNAAFRAGWRMARTTNKQLGISAKKEEGR